MSFGADSWKGLKNRFQPKDAVAREQCRETRHVGLLLAPDVGAVTILYLGGLALAVLQSLGYLPVMGLPRVTGEAYLALVGRPEFFQSLLLTTGVAGASTALALVLGLATALLIRRPMREKRAVTFLYQLNLVIPHSVGAIAVLLLFSQSGLLARLAHAAGIIRAPSEFPALVFDPWGVGIILKYAWKMTVFTGVVLLAALSSGCEDHEATARTLGANAWQRFRYVTWPLLRPSLMACAILVFAFAFSEYQVPFLLGQRSIALLPVLAFREYNRVDLENRPVAMALSVVIAVVISVLLVPWVSLRSGLNSAATAVTLREDESPQTLGAGE